MAPGIASTAYAMTDDVIAQITNDNSDGGSGDSSGSDSDHYHHHHHHDDGSGPNSESFFFSGSGNHSSHNSSSDGGTSGFESSTFSGQQEAINLFLSDSSMEDRTGVLITAAFSIAAAMIIIYCIVYDAYRVKPGNSRGRQRNSNGALKVLHTAEVFPFILATAVILQGFIFVGVQAGGLNDFEVSGCRLTSELIWPAFWLIPLLVLVFSLETTIRAIRSPCFDSKGRFNTPLCLLMVITFLVGLWVTTFLLPSLDVCPGSLSWWTVNYAKIAVILGSSIIFMHFICGAIITVQLMKTIHVDADERIAASRVVYILAIDTAILALVLPFWIQIVQGQFALESSKVSDTGITLSGLLFGALHLIMRTNSEKLAIRPKNTPWAKNKKMRLFGPNDLHNKTYISPPLIEPNQGFSEAWYSEKSEASMHSPESASRGSWPAPMYPGVSTEHSTRAEPDNLYEDDLMNQPEQVPTFMLDERPLPPEPVQVANPYRTRYSVFPSNREFGRPRSSSYPPQTNVKDSWVSSRSDASSEYVELPQPLFAYRHERKDSAMTSATVEIGIRLSFAPELIGRESRNPIVPLSAKALPPTPAIEVETPTTVSASSPSDTSSPQQSQMAQAPNTGLLVPVAANDKLSTPQVRTGATVGIGALGLGPKGGLRPFASQPVRASPLSNVIKSPATPSIPENLEEASRKGSVASDASSKSSTSSDNTSPKRPHSPAVAGLPSSPRPGRSPTSPQGHAKSPLGSLLSTATIRSSIESSPTTVSPDSPTEWPRWPPRN